MAFGQIVTGHTARPLRLPTCSRLYVDAFCPSFYVPEMELDCSDQRLIPIKSLCLEDAIRSACAMEGPASVGGGLQWLQESAEAGVPIYYS